MVVTWNEPNDNGSPIQGYWVEKREVNSTHWARVNRTIIPDLEISVLGLLEGMTYIFRVCAENVAGPGKFSPPSEPKTAQASISKCIPLEFTLYAMDTLQFHFNMNYIIMNIISFSAPWSTNSKGCRHHRLFN